MLPLYMYTQKFIKYLICKTREKTVNLIVFRTFFYVIMIALRFKLIKNDVVLTTSNKNHH